MIAITFAAVSILMAGGSADLRPWQDQQGGAASEADAQVQPQAADAASGDRTDPTDNEATHGAEAASVSDDEGVPDPRWLLGLWCEAGQYRFTIRGNEMIMADGRRSLLGVMRIGIAGVVTGDGPVAAFDYVRGEAGFHINAPGGPHNLQRC